MSAANISNSATEGIELALHEREDVTGSSGLPPWLQAEAFGANESIYFWFAQTCPRPATSTSQSRDKQGWKGAILRHARHTSRSVAVRCEYGV